MKPPIDFLLAEAFADDLVTGRNCGADIFIGTVFTGLYRRDFPVSNGSVEISNPELVFVCDVSLRLSSIEMYRRTMDFVAHGSTALLRLAGPDFVTVRMCVSTAPEGTSFSLCAFDEPLSEPSPATTVERSL